MLPLLALAVVFVAGCSYSKDEDKPSGNSKAPPPSKPATDQAYRRSCLNDATCPAAEREASIYDYVGAVYGVRGKVYFGKPGESQALTVTETIYVVGKFGALKLAETESYLSNAQGIFFRDLKFPPDPACRSEKAGLPPSFNHAQWGSALVLHGRHGCGSSYTEQLLKSGVELSLAADPAPWRFYLESYGTEIAKKVQLEEMALFTRMGETLGIPLANPLPHQASSLEVLNEAAKGSKYKPEDFAVAMVFQVAANASMQNPSIPPAKIFQDVIDKLALGLKIPADQLFEKTRLFLREYPTMQGQLEESDVRGRLLAETANRVNQGELSKQVSDHPSASRKSVFVLGSNHVDLVKKVYSSKK